MTKTKKKSRDQAEDLEDLKFLEIIKILITQQEKIMADMNALLAAIGQVKTNQDGLVAKLETLETEVQNAENRLEAKIAALGVGVDTQPAIDALAPINQAIADKSAELDTKIAEQQTTGV